MEEVHDLAQQLLGLVLTGHVGKVDAGGGGHVHLGPGAAAPHAEHHAVGAAHGLLHPPVEEVADEQEGQQGEHPPHQEGGEHPGLGVDLLEHRAAVVEALGPVRVVGPGGAVDILVVLVREGDLVPLDLHLAHILVIGHGHELVIGHVLHPLLEHGGEQGHVQHHDNEQRHNIVEDQRFF